MTQKHTLVCFEGNQYVYTKHVEDVVSYDGYCMILISILTKRKLYLNHNVPLFVFCCIISLILSIICRKTSYLVLPVEKTRWFVYWMIYFNIMDQIVLNDLTEVIWIVFSVSVWMCLWWIEWWHSRFDWCWYNIRISLEKSNLLCINYI